MDSNQFYDERYEFNAPKNYFDFTNYEEDETKDSYFDCINQGKSKSNEDLSTISPATRSTSSSSRSSSRVTAVLEEKMDMKEQLHHEMTETSTRDGQVDTVTSTEVTTVQQNTDNNMEDDSQTAKAVTRSDAKGILGNDGVFQSAAARHSPRLAAIAEALRGRSSSGSSARAGSLGSSSVGFKGRRRSASATPGHRSIPPGGRRGRGLSAEERAQLAMVARDTAQSKTRSKQMGTQPVEFHFMTDCRVKKPQAMAAVLNPAHFAKMLRSNQAPAPATKGPLKATRQQPFNLTVTKKSKAAEAAAAAEPFHSMAELNMKFHSQTPLRFKTKPKKDGEFYCWTGGSTAPAASGGGAGLTKPVSPALSTRARTRPNTHLSHDQLEEEELIQLQQKQFKARPLNMKVFEAPRLPNVAASKKSITIVQPFHITESKKEQQIAASQASMEHQTDGNDESMASSVSSTASTRRRPTQTQPFSFHDRDQRSAHRKQSRIDEVVAKEKELAEFQAGPMPEFSGGPRGLPSKRPPPATKSHPFNLNVDQRAEDKKDNIDRKKVERLSRERSQRHFTAKPAKVIQQEPFVPERSHKPLTEISSFTLNTEKRSDERLQYDMQLKLRGDMVSAEKRRAEEEREVAEDIRLADERRATAHRARKMPEFPLPSLQLCAKPLTTPLTPHFATDARLRSGRGRAAAAAAPPPAAANADVALGGGGNLTMDSDDSITHAIDVDNIDGERNVDVTVDFNNSSVSSSVGNNLSSFTKNESYTINTTTEMVGTPIV